VVLHRSRAPRPSGTTGCPHAPVTCHHPRRPTVPTFARPLATTLATTWHPGRTAPRLPRNRASGGASRPRRSPARPMCRWYSRPPVSASPCAPTHRSETCRNTSAASSASSRAKGRDTGARPAARSGSTHRGRCARATTGPAVSDHRHTRVAAVRARAPDPASISLTRRRILRAHARIRPNCLCARRVPSRTVAHVSIRGQCPTVQASPRVRACVPLHLRLNVRVRPPGVRPHATIERASIGQ